MDCYANCSSTYPYGHVYSDCANGRTGLVAGGRLRAGRAIGAFARRLQQVLEVPDRVGVERELLAQRPHFRRQRFGPAGELHERRDLIYS